MAEIKDGKLEERSYYDGQRELDAERERVRERGKDPEDSVQETINCGRIRGLLLATKPVSLDPFSSRSGPVFPRCFHPLLYMITKTDWICTATSSPDLRRLLLLCRGVGRGPGCRGGGLRRLPGGLAWLCERSPQDGQDSQSPRSVAAGV